METTDLNLTPRPGDVVRTNDGYLWRVTSAHDEGQVAAVTRLGDQIEMAIPFADVDVVEPHPGGQRSGSGRRPSLPVSGKTSSRRRHPGSMT